MRGTDDLANLEVPGAGITVNVGSAPPGPCPLLGVGRIGRAGQRGFPPTPIRSRWARFRTDTDGFIQSVRFSRGPGNGGARGKLLPNDGTLLANATFTGESAGGWQQVDFGTPVAITAGVSYVASVWLPQGHYALDSPFFQGHGLDRAPIHLLQDGVDGPNAVYHYTTEGFPTSTFGSSNYWVDVVFMNTAAADETPPVITGIAPGNGASGVAVTTSVTASFNEQINAATVSGARSNCATRRARSYPRRHLPEPGHTAVLAHGPLAFTTTYGQGHDRSRTWPATRSRPTRCGFTTSPPPPPPPTEGTGRADPRDQPGDRRVQPLPGRDPARRGLEPVHRDGPVVLVTPSVLAAHDVVVLGTRA